MHQVGGVDSPFLKIELSNWSKQHYFFEKFFDNITFMTTSLVLKTWIGSDQTVIRVPHRRLVVQELEQSRKSKGEQSRKSEQKVQELKQRRKSKVGQSRKKVTN